MGRLKKGSTGIATYTQEGRILVDDEQIATYDADGGTWDYEVRTILAGHGWRVDGPWDEDAENGSSFAPVYEPTVEAAGVPIAPEGLVTGQNSSIVDALSGRRDADHGGAVVWAEGMWRPLVTVNSRARRYVDVVYKGSTAPSADLDGNGRQRVIPERIALEADRLPGYYRNRMSTRRPAPAKPRPAPQPLPLSIRIEIQQEIVGDLRTRLAAAEAKLDALQSEGGKQ